MMTMICTQMCEQEEHIPIMTTKTTSTFKLLDTERTWSKMIQLLIVMFTHSLTYFHCYGDTKNACLDWCYE